MLSESIPLESAKPIAARSTRSRLIGALASAVMLIARNLTPYDDTYDVGTLTRRLDVPVVTGRSVG